MPTANAIPARETTLIERPSIAIATKDATTETGIARPTTSVARGERRKIIEDEDRDCAAEPDILYHEVDRGVDVNRLVVELAKNEFFLRDRSGIEIRDRLANATHRLDDICADLTGCIDRNRRFAVRANTLGRLLEAIGYVGNIADEHACDAAGARLDRIGRRPENHLTDGLDGIELRFRPYHIPAFSLFNVTARDRDIGRSHPRQHFGDGQAIASHLRRVDDDPNFFGTAAVNLGCRNAWHTFQRSRTTSTAKSP